MSLLGYVLLLTAALCCTAATVPEGSCPRPERLPEAELQGDWDKDVYPPATEAVYLCRPGYSRLGTIKRVCLKGKWEVLSKGQCRKKSCGHPGDIAFGFFKMKNEEESFDFGAVVQYFCDEGHQMVSKETTRVCTASGWSNYQPHCEVRNCPPVQAADNVNVLSTSYDEEYSVGQVVRFQCKDPTLKLNGPSEIFCTSEGEWNLETPKCIEIKCELPLINNGQVNQQKEVYKHNEVIQITCDEGYRTTSGEATCTKDDWNPKPSCDEIVCFPYAVENGRMVSENARYKYIYGEEIDVECEKGYVLQVEPNKRRKCTANGWSPPPRCVSEKCSKPVINHGSTGNYNFPLESGRKIYYRCGDNYLTPGKYNWDYIYCTDAGWNPEPKCLRKCYYSEATLGNARLINSNSEYLEGEKVKFQCNRDYQTPDGKPDGERTCLPDGKFTPAKCSRFCTVPRLNNVHFDTDISKFEIGEYLHFTCEKGYMTESKSLRGSVQCLEGRWSETPRCIRIICEINRVKYYDGDVISYTCRKGKRPASDSVQCYNTGWGPPISCQDIECIIPGTSDLIRSPHKDSYKINSNVSFSCKEGFSRVGPLTSICTEEDWEPSLPTCQDQKQVQPEITEKPSDHYIKEDKKPVLSETTEIPTNDNKEQDKKPVPPETTGAPPNDNENQENRKKCPPAFTPKNTEIIDPKEAYYSNDKVTMKCGKGYKMVGSPTIQCIEGKWEQPPECIRVTQCRNPTEIPNGYIITSSKQDTYVTDDVITYKCQFGFHFSGSDQRTCMDGQWSAPPICIEDPCKEAPAVPDASVIENKNTFNHGERATYKCNKGFRFTGEDSASCLGGKWINIPTCVTTSCTRPPNVQNARINGQPKASYASGEKVTYSCNAGYALETSLTGEAQCENKNWINLPKCRRIGEQCGPPPTVQSGDTLEIRKVNYKSGESVEYKCPNYYILQGNKIVRCLNGVWDKAPVCLEPCTAKENDMEENNIQLRWKSDIKLYSKHGEFIQFACKPGYEAPSNTNMRFQCEHGKLEYPKCFKKGFCVLQQSTMITNNIHYNISTVVDPGKIVFQCIEGMTAESNLEAKCEKGNINYPKCTATKSCKTPEILNGFLKTEPQTSYDSGSHVEFECNKDYVINGNINVNCENSQWIDLPVCLSPCKVSSEDLTKHNIQLLSAGDPKNILDQSYKHGSDLRVICKSGFRRSNQASLVIECYDGKFTYPKCFSGKTCRIDQEELDVNNLELDEVHDNEVYYEEGDTIQFKCKSGFRHPGKPSGTCSKETLTYPTCTESSV